MSTLVNGGPHAFDAAKESGRLPFKVADINLAELGRKEIELAQHEMPGLMAVRAKYAAEKPLAGAIPPRGRIFAAVPVVFELQK